MKKDSIYLVSPRSTIKFSIIYNILFCFILLFFTYHIFNIEIPPNPQFLIKSLKSNLRGDNTRIFESFVIPEPDFLAASHSATIEVLSNGDLRAMWFAGSHEGKPDVKIWQSKFSHESWSMATYIVSPETIGTYAKRFIKKVGNPVIYQSNNGTWHLFVVSVGIGGWSGSSLNHFISSDEGQSWNYKGKLVLSPFFNMSTLDRTKPIDLNDGGFYLPVYHEFIHTYPELLRFDKDGNFIQQIRMTSQIHLLQPSIMPINDSQGYAFLRNGGHIDHTLYMQRSNDGGLSWSNPESTNLENYDSSLAAINLGDNRLLMAHNLQKRDTLVLSTSADGKNWRQIYVLESTANGEFSYPAIAVHDDLVDILYTWDRTAIKHIRFNKAWLDTKLRKSSKSWNI